MTDIDPSTLDNIAYDVCWFQQANLTDELKANDYYTIEAVEEALVKSHCRQEMWDDMITGLTYVLSQLCRDRRGPSGEE